MQISHGNTQTPLVLTASVPAQIPRSEDKIISINPPNNILLTEKKGSTHELGLENQNHDEINIQETLSTKDIEESKKDPDQQNSPKTHHSDTNPTFLNLIRKTSIASPVLEPEDQLGLTTSPKKLSIDNLSTAMQDPKLELKPGKNLQDNNMTTYKESFEEGDPKGLSINTKDGTKLESQQSVNSNKIQGVDPKISEALNLSNDEQFILQHENSNKTIQGDDPKISEALNLFNDEQVNFQNKNSTLSNQNQITENPSQISKKNEKKELEKTSVDSTHNNGLAIEKDELKNNKASKVEKKIEKIIEDVDIPEKNKTKPKITEDLKTDLPKKKYDNLKKFANNHSKKKNLLKGVQQKTVSNNDSKTLHIKKDKQLEDSSPIEVLNNHKKSIVEDAHDNSSILRVNGNVSAGKKIKDDGKPQNSVQKNDFISFKVKPFLNGIIPAITLNFTISRRVL
ncbi:hypothetical protein NBO_10g0102 [Nosema bombycis CQ1]|uniref:Uncharacterized protein n=1 Tax=Nosema bombycis (strain CQ1 / CVCC 102059) TaxID=578461 RepID=R0KY17_NOSB1|nr:hypothetical protein NBO_10g0102 [Nosema bombycis CQ1]|eukprot:EOB15112.1 hypothetical protein NBO_10g0102 [Nosema bombycis CQ1]